jgi:hypothetical protein
MDNWCIKLTEENKEAVISYLDKKHGTMLVSTDYYYGEYENKLIYGLPSFEKELTFDEFKEMVVNETTSKVFETTSNNLDFSKHIPFLQGLENDTKEYGIVDISNSNVGLLDFDLDIQPKQIQSDGGSTPYYQITITNDKGETFNCELNDILRDVFNNQWDLCNIVKASRRISEARQGKGKKDVSIQYDANKIIWFAEEIKKYGK